MNQPNFGMALKIKPSARKFLESKAMAELEKLPKIGEEMKHFKYYDLATTKFLLSYNLMDKFERVNIDTI